MRKICCLMGGPRKSGNTNSLLNIVININNAITSYHELGYDIIYIKHILPPVLWGVGFSIKGTEGAELYDRLKIVSNLVFEKNHPDSFTSQPFRDHMKEHEYEEVVLCGLDECGCVGATSKGAVKTGVNVFMLTDCIGSRFSGKKIKKMRDSLKALGVQYI